MKMHIIQALAMATLLSYALATPAQSPANAPAPPSVPPTPPPSFQWLPLGEIRPTGWIREQMLRDLHTGFAGHLDSLAHEASSDIFATNRNRPDALNKANQDGVAWWNGETEGNWRTGFIMMAGLTGDRPAMQRSTTYIAHILASQDKDGYIGINAPSLRYKPGDLWTKTCLLRGLLAYAALTGRKDVFEAVRRAANQAIYTLSKGQTKMDWRETHDLMFCDILEQLFEQTGDNQYRDFAAWLYEDFGKHARNPETSLDSLLKIQAPFTWHGVHIYEHLRVPLWLWQTTGRTDMGEAWKNAVHKLDRYSFPGGAAVSMELVSDKAPDPYKTESEYCCIKEIQFDMESALMKTGLATYGERVERTWFNDAQAWRMPDGSAITYLAPENQLACNGKALDGHYDQPRNKYSPTHADAAVCCNPNATQVAPLYVRGMWGRSKDGLAALLYGPCKVNTIVNGQRIEISEVTHYPFRNQLTFRITTARETSFTIWFRNPSWSPNTSIICNGARITRHGDYWEVKKKWKTADEIHLSFSPTITEVPAVNGEVALQYGALLFAYPIKAEKIVKKTYPIQGFEDSWYLPAEDTTTSLTLPATLYIDSFKVIYPTTDVNMDRPFDRPVVMLKGFMSSRKEHRSLPVTLVPLGNAYLLRRLTFPAK